MRKLVECVPNFSEGRNPEIIEAIADAIRQTPGCTLLDVDPGKSTNRTVYTFVGSPEAVVVGALNSAKVARKLIDMRNHHGEHPRMGAMDVCPFVPVAGVTMEDCVECAKEFGRRAAEEIGIPLYLYEYAQEKEYRKKLPQIREGEYEELAGRIKTTDWKPDFGPAEFVPEWGATVTGARFFLIAYNINILGTNNQAHRIALNIREAGRGEDEPGLMKEIKAIGWFVEEYNMAQVSINMTNYLVSPPHIVFEQVLKEAKALNVGIAGSELVGLMPLGAILMAADYYIKKENLFIIEEDQKIKLVVDRLGLNSISKFEPEKKIIEYIVAEEAKEPLASLSVRKFVESVAARTSAPGGGSVSALLTSLGVGLGTMVSRLTYGVRKFDNVEPKMRKIIPPLYEITQKLIPMIDADTNAFNDYLEGVRMPKDSPEQQAARNTAMQTGLKKAIEIPLTTMRLGDSTWDSMIELAKYGNIASKSDVEVGARSIETGIWGAYKNVLINLPGIQDETFKKQTLEEADAIVKRAKEKCNRVLSILEKREKK
ncbi:MAG: glutamate formimidoyltransferase [Ignavibacteria bacterium GWB2_35_12]|nr:MAG: glutamate formimidoyltransferase [Ignavibacteria bacterium GWB2_35_12]OGU89756.1 MAG: glutamate formimidoyltransferase [Ignavibacteria bacterium RIFOXYA2_FULL_35_10]OGV24013.1 MAG: glutamate formimidoyltransferase [Ignavibacteria bacterium RIFOXYC2_FULL_35_21]